MSIKQFPKAIQRSKRQTLNLTDEPGGRFQARTVQTQLSVLSALQPWHGRGRGASTNTRMGAPGPSHCSAGSCAVALAFRAQAAAPCPHVVHRCAGRDTCHGRARGRDVRRQWHHSTRNQLMEKSRVRAQLRTRSRHTLGYCPPGEDPGSQLFKLALGPPCHFREIPERKTIPRSAGVSEPPSPEVPSTFGAASTPLLPKALLPEAHHQGRHPRALAASAVPSRTLHSPPVSWASFVAPSACHLAPFRVIEGKQCHRTRRVPLRAQHDGGKVSLQLDTGLTRQVAHVHASAQQGPPAQGPHPCMSTHSKWETTVWPSGPLHPPVKDTAGLDPPLPLCCPHLSQPRAVLSSSGFQDPCNPQVSEASPSSSGGPEPPSQPCAGTQSLHSSAARAAALRGQSASQGPGAHVCSLPELLQDSQNMLHCDPRPRF